MRSRRLSQSGGQRSACPCGALLRPLHASGAQPSGRGDPLDRRRLRAVAHHVRRVDALRFPRPLSRPTGGATLRLFLGATPRSASPCMRASSSAWRRADSSRSLAGGARLPRPRDAWPRPRALGVLGLAYLAPSRARRRASISPVESSFSTTPTRHGHRLRHLDRRGGSGATGARGRHRARLGSLRDRRPASGFSPGLTNLRFVSTTTAFVRPCEMFCRTVPCVTPDGFRVSVFFGVTLRSCRRCFRVVHSISSAAPSNPGNCRNHCLIIRGSAPVAVERHQALQCRLTRLTREHGSMDHILPQKPNPIPLRRRSLKALMSGHPRMHHRLARLVDLANAVLRRLVGVEDGESLARARTGCPPLAPRARLRRLSAQGPSAPSADLTAAGRQARRDAPGP